MTSLREEVYLEIVKGTCLFATEKGGAIVLSAINIWTDCARENRPRPNTASLED